ncbi:MAG TPA: hypothetical protein VGE09_03250 [Pseudoxanthomonas sp.]
MTGETPDSDGMAREQPAKFGAVGVAAEEAAQNPDIVNPPSTPEDQPTVLSPKARVETYDDQVLENMRAHRQLRTWAFFVAGGIALAFFGLLWCALKQVFFDGYLAGILGASTQPDSWHSLVLIGVSLALLATIPLSLCLALVRMVSDKDQGDESSVKMATTELGKVLYDLIKGFVTQAKGS